MRVLLLSFLFVSMSFSQEISTHALGLRLGSNDGFGTEISYQKSLWSNNRLEVDLGWRSSKGINYFKTIGLYQWVWELDGSFNWYAGAGGGISFLSATGYSDNNIVVAGNIGIEYNFEFPLFISLDARPEVYIGNNLNRSFGPDIALSLRYQF